MDTILGLVLLFSSAFYDGGSCTVSGYIYRESDSPKVSFSRVDLCQDVRFETDLNSLVLYSPHIWVRILIEPDHGNRRFMYRWSSNLAHLGAQTIPIDWGYVEKG